MRAPRKAALLKELWGLQKWANQTCLRVCAPPTCGHPGGKAPKMRQQREKALKRFHKWIAKPGNRELHNSRNRRRAAEVKREAFQLLGGCCAFCGNCIQEALEVDHVNGRRGGDRSTGKQLAQAIVNGDVMRHEVQLLCGTCHNIKSHNNGEYVSSRGAA